MADDIDCGDLSGWLVEPGDIGEFEPIWRDTWTGLPDRFDFDMVVAHWSGDPYDPRIEFDFYNRRIDGAETRAQSDMLSTVQRLLLVAPM